MKIGFYKKLHSFRPQIILSEISNVSAVVHVPVVDSPLYRVLVALVYGTLNFWLLLLLLFKFNPNQELSTVGLTSSRDQQRYCYVFQCSSSYA